MTLWEILKANKTGIAPDMFTMLAASKMNGGRDRLHELSGIPPLSFMSKGKPLTAWSITGNTVQNGTPTPDTPQEVKAVGDRTGNLFDYSTIRTGYRIAWATGADYADNTAMMSDYIKVKNTTYSCSDKAVIICYDGNKNYLGALNKSMVVEKEVGTFYDMFTINDNECKFIKLLTYQGFVIGNKTMLNAGSTALPYEPYGYKIPVVTKSDGTEPITTPIYLPTPLYSGEVMRSNGTIARSDGTTETFTAPQIPTLTGTTVIDVDTAVKPESMTIKYRR